jgi:DNA-directed RNA polymerase specialized sigma24 family protein
MIEVDDLHKDNYSPGVKVEPAPADAWDVLEQQIGSVDGPADYWAIVNDIARADPREAAQALADLPVEWRRAFVVALVNGLPQRERAMTLNGLVMAMAREHVLGGQGG